MQSQKRNKEAKQAARNLKIKSRKEYYSRKRYLEDSGLTCNPDRKFKNKGWVSWEDFPGSKKKLFPYKV